MYAQGMHGCLHGNAQWHCKDKVCIIDVISVDVFNDIGTMHGPQGILSLCTTDLWVNTARVADYKQCEFAVPVWSPTLKKDLISGWCQPAVPGMIYFWRFSNGILVELTLREREYGLPAAQRVSDRV